MNALAFGQVVSQERIQRHEKACHCSQNQWHQTTCRLANGVVGLVAARKHTQHSGAHVILGVRTSWWVSLETGTLAQAIAWVGE